VSERIRCVCGRVWSVRRFGLPLACQDEAICPCGQTLKYWNEAADYVFEPEDRPAGMVEIRPLLPRPDLRLFARQEIAVTISRAR
jgi:hypothetical protein